GVVVRTGHEADAVPDADALGARCDGAVEDLGVRAVGVLGEEVMLDCPEGIPAEAITGDGLLDRVLIGPQLALLVPRAGDGDLVEEGEAHRPHTCRRRADEVSPSEPKRSGGETRTRFEGKTVVVTGAASGIGQATVQR